MTSFQMLRRLTRWTLAGASAALLVAAATPARAQAPAFIGDQPAATLLLPYFEVDLTNPAGANTLFSVNNASATAVLAHVTVWSTMHVPVFTFDVYLTGYDMQTINVRDVIDGTLPRTASDGQDLGDSTSPTDGISNQGMFSQDINFASCNATLPYTALPQSTVDHIRASLTGAPSAMAGGKCASTSDGTNVARGYITVDTVNSCSSLTPRDLGYFVNGGGGVATNQNVLWGDATYVNHLGGREQSDGDPLVHIRAFPGGGINDSMAVDPETSTPGEYTFYGRLVAWTAADNREPLATTFATRFSNGGAFPITTLTVWRDSKVNQDYFACGTQPAWFPLGQESVAIFDEQEDVEQVASVPFAPPVNSGDSTYFPYGTQRRQVGTDIPTTKQFGWMFLNLNFATIGGNPPEDPGAAQAWVGVHMKGAGRYGVGWHATQMDSARTAQHIIVQ